MRNMHSVYDDGNEVIEYYWRNYRGKDGLDLVGVEKAIVGKSELHRIQVIAQRPDFIKYLDMSIETVKKSWANDQITKGIPVNRCPKCNKVMISPRTRQCLYCNFDWHDGVAPNESLKGSA